METGARSCVITVLAGLSRALLLLLFFPGLVLGDAGVSSQTYCSVPPVPGAGVKSNLLLLLDNSASMYDLAYSNTSSTTSYCFDDSYNDAGSYPGYFEQTAVYRYQPQGNAALESGNFVRQPGVTLPAGSCNQADNSYLCLDTGAGGEMTAFLASGRFLNWLTMSKFDLERQALTGGKMVKGGVLEPAALATGMLQAETRGCQGRSFVKATPDGRITFAVRGPISREPDYQENRGGMTRLEVFAKPYHLADCQAAIAYWQSGDLEQLKLAAARCAGGQPDVGGIPSPGTIFFEAMTDCLGYLLAGRKLDPYIPIIKDYCSKTIRGYNDSAPNIPKNNGEGICCGQYFHLPNPQHSASSGGRGFVGQCWMSGLGFWSSDSCVKQEFEDFCNDLTTPPLTDPSQRATTLGSEADLPGYILDGGLSALGPPAATLLVRLETDGAHPPSGLIQQYAGEINFTAMAFNETGAGSECGGRIPCVSRCPDGTQCLVNADCKSVPKRCVAEAKLDGGRFVASLSGPESLGSFVISLNAVNAYSWTPLAETYYQAIGYFARDARFQLQSQDYTGVTWPSAPYSCQRNSVLILTDGISSGDRAAAMNSFVARGWVNLPASLTTRTSDAASAPPGVLGSYNLDDLAWIARHKRVTNFGGGATIFDYSPALDASYQISATRDYLSTFILYTGETGHAASAVTGSDGRCLALDESQPEQLLQLAACQGGGSYASVRQPGDLASALANLLQQIGAGSNSGSDAAILSTGAGNGALFLQQQYYPSRSLEAGNSVSWIGEMRSLWYFIDPFTGGSSGSRSSIREDSDADRALKLKKDRVVELRYDSASGRSYAYLSLDPSGTGAGLGPETCVELDQVQSLWQAGRQLWNRDLTAAPRSIYTPALPGAPQLGSSGLMQFSFGTRGSTGSTGNASWLRPYLLAGDTQAAAKLIQFVHGFDFPGDLAVRSRTLTGAGLTGSADPGGTGVGVWKLGDLIGSTPQVQSGVALASYHLPAPGGYGDVSYASFINSNQYRRRGMVYAGGNDGMLHAFSLGQLATPASGEVKATLSGSDAGSEKWAVIPKQVLPYLGYLAQPGYRHLFYVDGRSTLVDASIGDTGSGVCQKDSYWRCSKPESGTVVDADNDLDPGRNTWRTVLIGAMGKGGASALACSGSSCVPTPAADPGDPSGRTGLGYSSYFALDVTDPEHPALLWEFSHPSLGYSTSGPAVVRVGAPDSNGRWFAIFGSGPTGPIDPASHQFLAQSGQPLSYFVVDLRSGALISIITARSAASGDPIENAFAGSLAGAAIDTQRWLPGSSGNYQDDAVYAGFVKKAADGTWTEGGVGRLQIDPVDTPDDDRVRGIWHWSCLLEGIGPVTGAVAKLQDRNNKRLWLYFGTGRYFFSQDDQTTAQHSATRRALYGVKDPCYGLGEVNQLKPVCGTAPLSAGDLVDQTGAVAEVAADDPGWRIDLDPGTTLSGAERLLVAPTAISGGAVYFPTFQPSTDPCQLGESYLWTVRYDTGGVAAALKSKVLVQLSTGNVKEADRSGRGGRRSSALPGRPAGIKVVSNSGLKPVKKILHIQER